MSPAVTVRLGKPTGAGRGDRQDAIEARHSERSATALLHLGAVDGGPGSGADASGILGCLPRRWSRGRPGLPVRSELGDRNPLRRRRRATPSPSDRFGDGLSYSRGLPPPDTGDADSLLACSRGALRPVPRISDVNGPLAQHSAECARISFENSAIPCRKAALARDLLTNNDLWRRFGCLSERQCGAAARQQNKPFREGSMFYTPKDAVRTRISRRRFLELGGSAAVGPPRKPSARSRATVVKRMSGGTHLTHYPFSDSLRGRGGHDADNNRIRRRGAE